MKVLDLQAEDNTRIIVIGDIHGCYKTFLKLLKKCNYHEGRDILISVGDLINKGPDSKRVTEYFHQHRDEKHRVYAVLGNNEQRLLKPESYASKKIAFPHNLNYEEITFLKNLPLSIRFKSFFPTKKNDLVIVHAGLVPGVALENQRNLDMNHMRNIKFNDTEQRWIGLRKAIEGNAWITEWKGSEFVVFGHDGRRNLQVTRYALGLDTGCVYGRELSAAIFTTDRDNYEIVQIGTLENHQC